MSTTVSFAGTSYNLPNNREPKGWGAELSAFLIAVAQKAIPTTGGNMSLTAELNLGTSYGIVAPYFKSSSSNISTTGVIRFANNEGLGWRNAANSADLILKVDASNNLEYNGNDIPTSASTLAFFAATTSAQLAGVISDETGSGALVFANSPTLITPTIGVATATSINKVAITAPATSATLTIADGKTLTVSNTLTFTGTDASSVAFGTGGTVVYTANNLSVFAATTSAQLAGIISDETGSGSLVFGTAPTLSTPKIEDAADFEEQASTPATPSSGRQKIYPKTDGSWYSLDDAGIESPLGSGSGSGGVNLIGDPSSSANWSATGANFSAPSTTTTSGDLPIAGATDSAIKITASGAVAEATSYVSYSVTTGAAMSGRLQIDFFLRPGSGFAASEWTVSVYQGSTRQTLETDSSSVSYLPNATTRYTTSFDAVASTSYTLRFARVSGSGTAVLNICNVFFGWPFVSAVTPSGSWQSFTLSSSLNNEGTLSNTVAFYRQDGPDMIVWFYSRMTTDPSTVVTFTPPNSLTVDTSKLHSDTGNDLTLGTVKVLDVGTATFFGTVNYRPGSGIVFSTSNGVVSAGSPMSWTGTDNWTAEFRIPISEWAGAVSTVSVPSEEFVSGAITSDANTTTTVYGPLGSLVPTAALSTTRYAEVTFQYPLQSDDQLIIETDNQSTGNWLPHNANVNGSFGWLQQNSQDYGIYISPVSATVFRVNFARYAVPNGATYGAAGSNWSSLTTCKWRLRKTKKWALPFKNAGTDGSSGLYKPGQAPGVITGVAIGAGYVGQEIVSSRARSSASGLTTITQASILQIDLTPGSWLLSCTIGFTGTATATTQLRWGFNTSSVATPGATEWDAGLGGATSASNVLNNIDFVAATRPVRIDISANTTYFLNVYAAFSGGTCSAYGQASAIRKA